MSDPSHDWPGDWPTVSVIVPVRNEARHLLAAVEAILEQDYPKPFDVCLAVAPSDDATDAVAKEIVARHPNVCVIQNPAGTTPAGLNAAIRATHGEIVVRVDGHSRLSTGYIRRAVETLHRTGAANVGGIQAARGERPFERAVAAAMSSRFGTGGSRFHVGGAEGPVDTVYLGVFRRTALEDVGMFDEQLARNQDYELNIRLRNAGGTVWFDPELSVEYRPRGTLSALARQYFEYGWWKAEVARRHPGSLKARQIAPVVATLGVSISAASAPRSRVARLSVVAYVIATAIAAYAASGRRTDVGTRLLVIFPVVHFSWGTGFIASALRRRATGVT